MTREVTTEVGCLLAFGGAGLKIMPCGGPATSPEPARTLPETDPMARKQDPAPATMSAPRVARLYKLLTLLSDAPRTRTMLLKRLKVNLRAYYRDLHTLRELGIDIASTDESYSLKTPLAESLQKLPFPDPLLSFEEMLTLAELRGEVPRKLRARISSVTGSEWASRNGNGTH